MQKAIGNRNNMAFWHFWNLEPCQVKIVQVAPFLNPDSAHLLRPPDKKPFEARSGYSRGQSTGFQSGWVANDVTFGPS